MNIRMNIKPIDIIIVFIYNMAGALRVELRLTVLETVVLPLDDTPMFNLFGKTISPVIEKNTTRTKTSVIKISINITIKVIISSLFTSHLYLFGVGCGGRTRFSSLEGWYTADMPIPHVPPPKSHNTSIAISRNRTATAMVGMTGFEPAASCAQGKRATKLHHIPI